MEKTGRTILVTGATGNQGGAVARALHKEGWPVRAMTRDQSKPAALALSEMGITVVKGDYDDRGSIVKSVEGCYGVFSVQTFMEKGPAGETAQGILMADVAKAAGVSHFVYSSVAAADRKTGIPHFESKWEIERHIRKTGLNTTVLRPVFFMSNFLSPMMNMRSAIMDGSFSMPLRADQPLQMIALEDLATFVALAFATPSKYEGRAHELAGDEITMLKTAEVLGRAIGRAVTYAEMPIEQMRKVSEDMARMYQWFNANRFHADIPALKALHPQLMSFEEYVRQSEWTTQGR